MNDTTSFGSYLQFTGQDKPDTTAFIIYLLQKEKKEGEMETNPEYRKALREATQSASSKKVDLDLPVSFYTSVVNFGRERYLTNWNGD